MNIFSSIMNKIFNRDEGAASVKPASTAGTLTSTATAPTSTASTKTQASKPSGPVMPSTSGQTVDVEAVLTALAAKKKGEKLDWRKSIVDLMKLLDLDSSGASRKKLAAELAYTGDTKDSATMNVWLHKQVMRKLAENGGKVPADLKD